jgi:hypothetical protein
VSAETVWLLLLSVAVLLLTGAFAALWRRVRTPVLAEPPPALRTDFEALERRLGERLDGVLLALVNAQSSVTTFLATASNGAAGPAPSEREELPPEASRLTGPFDPQFELDPEEVSRRLEMLLNGQDFLQSVWPRLVNDFYDSRQQVQAFLQSNGVPAPVIEPYPRLQDGNPNHWVFMTIAPRGRRSGVRWFLVPRHFVRFDPSFQGHLFEVKGRNDDLEAFVRRLHRCAVVRPEGASGDPIDLRQVEVRGVISVSEGDS